jgi:hypothetical protein
MTSPTASAEINLSNQKQLEAPVPPAMDVNRAIDNLIDNLEPLKPSLLRSAVLYHNETNRVPKSRNPTPCIIVIVPGLSAITYSTHSRHNIIVTLCLRSNMGLIIT